MKLGILICILLILFVGFQLYGVIDAELEEAKLSPIQTVNMDDVNQNSVDNLMASLSYTHRVSTYQHPSTDLVKAASDMALSAKYISIIYYDDENLIHEEYAVSAYDNIDFDKIESDCIIVLAIESQMKTNLDSEDYSVYNLGEDFKLLHLQPKNTGKYQIETDQVMIKFHLIK